ncbi:MAG: hypothetical protein M3Z96_02485, partial [Pseudomonadota bacterium]|nr:hypothetical protein [Pseudomonadota bacterium]
MTNWVRGPAASGRAPAWPGSGREPAWQHIQPEGTPPFLLYNIGGGVAMRSIPASFGESFASPAGGVMMRQWSRLEAARGKAMKPRAKPGKLIEGATGDFEVVIGMEVHAQLTSKSKLFSGASTEFGKEPNSNVSLVDAAMPGMLPVINEECVAQAVRTGLGLKAKINLRSV